MKSPNARHLERPTSFRTMGAIIAAGIVVLIAGWFLKKPHRDVAESRISVQSTEQGMNPLSDRRASDRRASSLHTYGRTEDGQTAQEVVAKKLSQFGKLRRELAHGL